MLLILRRKLHFVVISVKSWIPTEKYQNNGCNSIVFHTHVCLVCVHASFACKYDYHKACSLYPVGCEDTTNYHLHILKTEMSHSKEVIQSLKIAL